MDTLTRKLTATKMINHMLIPSRYKGWVRMEHPSKVPGCVQYWHENLKQSLFFDDLDKTLMSTGIGEGKMYRTLLLGTWEDFEDCCQRCGITLDAA